MAKVAVLGFGTVGSGVAEVIRINAEKLAKSAQEDITLKYIVDVRDFPGNPFEDLIVHDFSVVENDPEVQVVVETIGGAKIAYEFTKRSLLAGKSVVTSNKELVATHGYELLNIAREKGVNYLFEASVGGGIPILRPLSQCLAANQIEEVSGILNGTTNYILTEMIKNGLSFETALKQAQANGFAEANPAADIEGHDACRKVCILSALSYGHHVYPDQVPTEGITGVTLDDVNFASAGGYKIKLLGRALLDADGKVAPYVAPHLVPVDAMLAGVEGVMNGIMVHGNAVGDVMFYGAGAGKMPTASAVVADVVDAVKHAKARKLVDWEEGGEAYVSDPGKISSKWYVRVGNGEKALPGCTVLGSKDGETAFLTDAMDKYQAEEQLKGMAVLSLFRVLD